MTTTIKYQSQLAEHTISSFTQLWAIAFSNTVLNTDLMHQKYGEFNLIAGNVAPILEIMKAQEIDVNIPLKDRVIASQIEAVAETSMISIVGVIDEGDISLATY